MGHAPTVHQDLDRASQSLDGVRALGSHRLAPPRLRNPPIESAVLRTCPRASKKGVEASPPFFLSQQKCRTVVVLAQGEDSL